MQITRLRLTNFRLYQEAELRFEAPTTVILGDNAQGKTSLLEAVCLLVRTKSHRTNRDEDLLRWGADQALCEADFQRRARGPVSLRVVLATSEAAQFLGSPPKQLAVNNNLVTGSRDVIGQVSAVVFSPDDLALAKGDPAGRRHFLNVAIGQTQPVHVADLQQYRRALQQRTQMLVAVAEGRASAAHLAAWDQQVARYGAEIALARGEYVTDLAQAAGRLQRELTGGQEDLTVRYRSSLWEEGGRHPAALEGIILSRLAEKQAQEINLRRTLTGPHRDDLALEVGGKDLRKYGSQGQQRTAVLALRLAEAELARARLNETPLVLLDDCLSELDEGRAGRVLEQAGADTQLLLTTTHLTPALRRKGEVATYVTAGGQVSPG